MGRAEERGGVFLSSVLSWAVGSGPGEDMTSIPDRPLQSGRVALVWFSVGRDAKCACRDIPHVRLKPDASAPGPASRVKELP